MWCWRHNTSLAWSSIGQLLSFNGRDGVDRGIKLRMMGEVVCGGASNNSPSWVHDMLAKPARHSGVSDFIPITTIFCFSLGADISFPLPVFLRCSVGLSSDTCKPTDLHIRSNMYVEKGIVGARAVPLCVLSQDSVETAPSPRTFQRLPAGLCLSSNQVSISFRTSWTLTFIKSLIKSLILTC
jgi:hypothetical protein